MIKPDDCDGSTHRPTITCGLADAHLTVPDAGRSAHGEVIGAKSSGRATDDTESRQGGIQAMLDRSCADDSRCGRSSWWCGVRNGREIIGGLGVVPNEHAIEIQF